jgi:ParB family chromosome partitioning protein
LEVADALSVGLMENISQEAMHPADEFAAFKALIDQGRTTQSIAASLAPELMKLYRKGDMQLDQVMAMAALDDPKRQVMLYRSLPNHSRTAQAIRRLIAQDDVSHQDPRVKLVGLPTYLAAGGGLREDLFSENAERFLTDPLLLEMLVAEAFEVQASSLRAQGWKWVDVLPEFTYTERGQYFAMPTKRLPESPVHLAIRLTLAAQLSQLQDRLVECAQGEEVDEAEIDALEEKVEAVDQQLQALDAQRVDTSARDKALAGVVLMLEGSKIKPLENMGRVSERKQIMAALAVRQQGSAGRSDSPQTANTPQEGGTLGEDSNSAEPMRFCCSPHRTRLSGLAVPVIAPRTASTLLVGSTLPCATPAR